MTTPHSKWPLGFENSKLSGLYAREMYWLAWQIKMKADELFQKYPVQAGEPFLSTDISGFDLIYSLLSNAAKLNELLYPKRKDQEYKERAACLRGLIGGLQLKHLCDKKVRNTVEHFAEHLDRHNLQHSGFSSPTRYVVLFNFVLSHMEPVHVPSIPFQLYSTPMAPVPVLPVRVYVTSARTFHNFCWSVDIAGLSDEANHVAAKLASQFAEENPEDWVSLIVHL